LARPASRFNKIGLAGWLILLFALTGCAVQGEDGKVATAIPSATVGQPTVILTSTPKTSTATPLATFVAQYSPTPALITPAPAEGTFADPAVVSPDGKWTALPGFETLSTGYRISLKIFTADKSIIWTPVDVTGDGLGYISPVPKHWSADSHYFYYSDTLVTDGCTNLFPLEKVWKRVNVESGQVDVFPIPSGRSHAYSPDDLALAYIPDSAPDQLIILNIADKTEQKIPLPKPNDSQTPLQAGDIRWSPDNRSLVYTVIHGSLCAATRPDFFLQTVNRSDLTVKTIYHGAEYLRSLEWASADKILVMDWSHRSWWVTAVTGEITTAPVR